MRTLKAEVEKGLVEPTQPEKLQKKQCGGVYFWLYSIVYRMPIQQKLTPPGLLFSDFAGWVAVRGSFALRIGNRVNISKPDI